MSEAELIRQKRIRSASQLNDAASNPCMKESKQSFNCMNENDYDKEKCGLYFQNYRNCLDFWNRVMRDRRRLGLEPTLPSPEDRDRIRQEYYEKSKMVQH